MNEKSLVFGPNTSELIESYFVSPEDPDAIAFTLNGFPTRIATVEEALKVVENFATYEAKSIVAFNNKNLSRTLASFYIDLVAYIHQGNTVQLIKVPAHELKHISYNSELRYEEMKKIITKAEDASKLPPPILTRSGGNWITRDGQTRISCLLDSEAKYVVAYYLPPTGSAVLPQEIIKQIPDPNEIAESIIKKNRSSNLKFFLQRLFMGN